MDKPYKIEGNICIDDRGKVSFVNGFHFDGVKRFYTISNHRRGFVRAWHAHRIEAKYVTVLQGAALVAAVQIDDWLQPNRHTEVDKWVLCGERPAVVFIPAGYANGFMSLTDDALIGFFSCASLEDSLRDDMRYSARYWNPWQIVER